jgi:prophage regulatory protein
MNTTRQPEKRQPIEAGTLPDALLKLATVEAMTGISRASIYRRLALDEFPQPVRLGRRCTRWPAATVRDWIQTQQAQAGKASQ